jgi:NADH-quinone oxidoreductase subunit H
MALFDSIGNWFQSLLTGLGLHPGLITLIMILIGVLIIVIFVLVIDIFLVWLERKVVARFQDRLGPNRLGPFGLVQPIADIIKLMIKEDTMPAGADKVVFNIAPLLALASVLLIWAVIPFAPGLLGADIDVSVLFIVAVGAIGTLSMIMAGWSSFNKYALLGAFRLVAQVIAYEIPMLLALLIPVMLTRSMGMHSIVEAQNVWYIFIAPVAAIILLIALIAEIGRSPFDLLEAESEIATGYVIEYSGMKFGLFYAGELLHALTVGAIFSTLFLGGWRGPFADQVPFLGVLYLFAKSFLVYFVIMWIRYTVPRIRIDHMLNFNWKFLTPLALILLSVTAIMDNLLRDSSTLVYSVGMLGMNVIVFLVTVVILRRVAVIRREQVAEPRPSASMDLSSPALKDSKHPVSNLS